MTEYIDITPTWEEILPTWLMLLEAGYTGRCANPSLTLSNAKAELQRMAQAADHWNDYCRQQLNSTGVHEIDEGARLNAALAPKEAR